MLEYKKLWDKFNTKVQKNLTLNIEESVDSISIKTLHLILLRIREILYLQKSKAT
nr:hypothetical protein [Mycoplasmopsis bovis]